MNAKWFRISKLYVLIISTITIVFVSVFTLSYFWTPNVVRQISKTLGDEGKFPSIQFYLDAFCTINVFILLPLSIYLVWKKKAVGYVGMVAALLFAYHLYTWAYEFN